MPENPKPLSRHLILGLSHIYGETEDIDKQVAFWQSRGLTMEFAWNLLVPDEKKQKLLHNQNASCVDLSYLNFSKPMVGPGIEFICHKPINRQTRRSANSALTLLMQAPEKRDVEDDEGNRIISSPGCSAPVCLVAATVDIKASGNFLATLGFKKVTLDQREEKEIGEIFSCAGVCWEFRLPLYSRLGVRVLLMEDKTRDFEPKVDELGWSGFSFLTPSLDEVERRFPLQARQMIKTQEAGEREVAFYNSSGLLVEFLKITAKRK
ncbi:MAG: hypothetical protein ACE5G9_03620 [Nitrospinales bacterium]